MEHPYGTIKRQWGYSYILPRNRINRASADAGLMFIACNLRRIKNILTMNVLKEYLRILSSLFLGIFSHTETFLRTFAEINIPALVFVKADYRSGKLILGIRTDLLLFQYQDIYIVE
jgi:hypothetical protein